MPLPGEAHYPLVPKNDSAFLSFLNWIGRPGQVVKNLATGNIGGAARQGADFLGDVIDLLPGDLIPEASRPEDYKTGADVLGVDKQWQEDHPVLGFLTSLPMDLALDPLTYTGLGPIAKVAGGAGKLAAEGISKLPGGAKVLADGAQAAKEAGHFTRKMFGAENPTPEIAAAERAARAKGAATRQAAQTAGVEGFAGVDPEIHRRAVEIIRGVTSEGVDNGYRDLGISAASKQITTPEQMALIDQRLAAMPWDIGAKAAVRQEADKIVNHTRGLWSQGVNDAVFTLPDDINATSSLATHQLEQAPADYFPGKYDLERQAELNPVPSVSPRPDLTKAKTYTTSKELAEGLTSTGAKLDTNVSQVLGEYGEQMGRAAQAASMGKAVAKDSYRALTDPASRKAVQDIADGLRAAGDLDGAHVIETVTKGVAAPGAFTNFLAKTNKPFKAAATGGILIPRINFTVGNVTSSVWQAFSNKEARGQTWNTAKRVIPAIFKSVGDGLKQLGIHAMSFEEAEQVAQAARESGGTREGMLKRIVDPDLRGAVEHGVLDGGFVNSEQMMADAAERLKGGKSLQNWLYWPQSIAKSSEQQLRFGLFKDLKQAGKSDADAARITNDTLLNYNMTSIENRAARNAMPFFQFTAKTIPQQAKLLAEDSLAGSATRNALRGGLTGQDDPVYGWMDGKANIPLGKDEKGNNQYLSDLRLPFETLGQIPNISDSPLAFGRDVEQSIGGAAHPLLKTAYSLVSGKDPYFDSPYGTYSKLPGNIEAGAVGRAYNQLSGTGLIQPFTSMGQIVGNFIDDRMSPAEKAVSLLTGAKIRSVDPDLALQQKLSEYLKHHPEVKSFESLYSKSDDPEVQALLRELADTKARMKKKRAASP